MTGVAHTDLSQPFKLEQTELRGRYVRLGSVMDRILKRQNYPDKVNRLLGELLVLASAFAGTLKFDGRFSLQVRGSGPIRLMVADCTNDGILRGYAGFEENELGDDDGIDLFGNAVLAIVVDQSAAGSETYQGIVELSDRGLADSVRGYFWQSEQVPTGLKVAANIVEDDGQWNGAALMVQSLPTESDDPSQGRDLIEHEMSDEWRRTMLLLETVSDDELLDRSQAATNLLWRVFHEDGVRVFEPMALAAGCKCSRSKVSAVLERFSVDELVDMRTEAGEIVVTCEFCGEEYRYDQSTVNQMINSRSH